MGEMPHRVSTNTTIPKPLDNNDMNKFRSTIEIQRRNEWLKAVFPDYKVVNNEKRWFDYSSRE